LAPEQEATGGASRAFEIATRATTNDPSVALRWFESEAAQYDRQIKVVGAAQAKAQMEIAVLGECPLLVSDRFTIRP